MYVHLELKTIPLELRDEAVERLSRLHTLMSRSDGFLCAQIWSDVSDPLEHMVTRAWVDAAAHAAYRASEAARAFAALRPPAPLWENTAVQEWLSSEKVNNLGSGEFLARMIDPAESRSPNATPGAGVLAGRSEPPGRFRDLAGDHTMWLWRFPERPQPAQIGTGAPNLWLYELITEIALRG